LDAPAIITLADGANQFSKLQEIKKYKRNSTNKQALGYICNVRLPNFRHGHLDQHNIQAS